jgi:hypothetical protein
MKLSTKIKLKNKPTLIDTICNDFGSSSKKDSTTGQIVFDPTKIIPNLTQLEKQMILFALKDMTHSNFDDELPQYVSSNDFNKLIAKLNTPYNN